MDEEQVFPQVEEEVEEEVAEQGVDLLLLPLLLILMG